jgi:hypothetical protein
MSKNKKVKSVSFNITNVKEKEFLDLLDEEQWEFSSYVKELIFADLDRRKAPLKIVKRSDKGGIKIVVASNTPPLSTASV